MDNRRFRVILTGYYYSRKNYERVCQEYEHAKCKSRKLLKAQNQLKSDLTKWYKHKLPSSYIEFLKLAKIYNDTMIPPTMMRRCDIRKSDAASCKELKAEVKYWQRLFNDYFNRLKELMECKE